jgi:copper binding plastocyanin/azurin family protein
MTLIAMTVAACGSDDDAQTITFALSGNGKAAKFTAPESADPGLTEITFENEGKGESDMQLIRVEGDHSPQEVIDGLGEAMKGQPFPDWFFAGGGAGPTPAGESRTVTQVLEPGTYYPFDTEGSEGPPDPNSMIAVEVNGEASEDDVEANATVSAFEYGYKADGLTDGEVEVAFENTGAQPHHIVYAPLTGGATAADAERYFKSGGNGKAPYDEKDTKSTAVVEGGEGQLVTLDLKPGRYVFFCFITDRQGSPPHALKGMVDEVEVE